MKKNAITLPRIVSSAEPSTQKHLLNAYRNRPHSRRRPERGFCSEFTHSLTEYLKDGYTVELGEIGYFSPSIKGRGVKTRKTFVLRLLLLKASTSVPTRN